MSSNKMKTLTINGVQFTIVDETVGSLSDLNTTDKSSVVAAVNEVASNAGSGSGGSSVTIDATLTQEGQAADAKAVGDAINNLSSNLSPNVTIDTTLTQSGQAADAKAVGDALAELEGKIPEESGGGVSDYAELNNKPKINGVEVSGDKTSADYGIGNPTDEQVGAAVESWLGEHPEATTTVADGSITEQKLADGAVSEVKAGFLSYDGVSANLFNKATATDGKKCESSWIGSADGYSVSDFIPVEENTTYCRSANTFDSYRYTLFYDADKELLSGKRHHSGTKVFTTPAGCAYVVIDMPTDAKDTATLVLGDTEPSEYVPYLNYYKLGDNIRIAVEGIVDINKIWSNIPSGVISKENMNASVQQTLDGLASVDKKVIVATKWNDIKQPTKKLTGRINVFEHTTKGVFDIATDISDKTIVVHGVNYFDKNDLIAGKLNSSGDIVTSTTGYVTEHLIPVQPGKKLFWNRSNADGVRSYLAFCYYDQNQQYLRNNVVGGAVIAGIFTPEEDVYYIRVTCGTMVDADAEKICIADVDVGRTNYGGYEGNTSIENVGGGNTYFGKNVYFPYVGYRIENGVFVGASDSYTLEEITHVDVFEPDSAVEVTAPVEAPFDKTLLRNVVLKYGRADGSNYVMARIFKTTIDGRTITPRVVAFNPGGKRADALAKENDFVIAINAGVFNMDDNSCVGNTISNGEIITDHVDSDTFHSSDTLAIDSSGNLLSYEYTTTCKDMLSDGVVHAVQGKGTLIVDYAIVDMDEYSEKLTSTSNAEEKHPRTVIGQYRDGDYMVFLCGGRTTNDAGMTMHEINEILVAEGVKYAYNLDGGGSCEMLYFKKHLAPYREGRSNPTYIVFD